MKGVRVSMMCPTLGAAPENHGERAERVIARWHAAQSLPQVPSSVAGQLHMLTSASQKYKTCVMSMCIPFFSGDLDGSAAELSPFVSDC